MGCSNSGGGKITSAQKAKVKNIEKVVEKNKYMHSLSIKNNNGLIDFSYKETRIVHKEKGGKMSSPDKADVYERTTTKSGTIFKDGLIKFGKSTIDDKLIKKGKRK